MFNIIVWATDGSENADRALPYAEALARRSDGSLVVAHVIERYATRRGLAVHPDEERVEAKLKALTAQLRDEGLRASLTIASHVGPQAAHAIGDLARETGANLVVVGCRGHAAVPGLVLGSVTQHLLHVSPCPVLVVPSGEAARSERIAPGAAHVAHR